MWEMVKQILNDGEWAEPLLAKDEMDFVERRIRKELGVYAVNGPTWEEDIKKICENESAETCETYTNEGKWQ